MAPGSLVGWAAAAALRGVLLRDVRLQRQRVDRAADLGAEDLVDQAVLLDAAAPGERRGGDGRAEVVAAAGVVLDLGRAPGIEASMRCEMSSAEGMFLA